MLLGTLGARLLGNMLVGKGVVRAGSGNKKGKGKEMDSKWKWNGLLMPSHPLANFEIQKYHQNEPRFNSVYSRNNLPEKRKDVVYVINLDEYADVGTH